jgi:hypothetical protein
MPTIEYRKIYDDEGDELREGEIVIVNGEHERIVYFNDLGDISLENWNWVEDMVFSIRKKRSPDDRYGDLDEPHLDEPKPSVPSKGQQKDRGHLAHIRRT